MTTRRNSADKLASVPVSPTDSHRSFTPFEVPSIGEARRARRNRTGRRVVRIPSTQQSESETSNLGMLGCSRHEEASDPLTPDGAVDEDITEPSERDTIGHPTCESHLGPRAHETAHRQLALFAEPPMNSEQIETISIVSDKEAIFTVHCTTRF